MARRAALRDRVDSIRSADLVDSDLVIFRRDAKVRLISQVPLFQGCSLPELTKVAGIMQQLEVPEGKVLIRQGEPGREFFVGDQRPLLLPHMRAIYCTAKRAVGQPRTEDRRSRMEDRR